MLVRSVCEMWKIGNLNELITKSFNCLMNVLVLIVEGNGRNEFVETKRGKRLRTLDLSVEQLSNINVEEDQHNIDDINDIDDYIDQFLDQDDNKLNNEDIIIEGW